MRRGALAASVLSLAGVLAETGCGRGGSPFIGTAAVPERSLAYAPLLLALRDRGGTPGAGRVSLRQLAGPQEVARAVAVGEADVAGMALPDVAAAVAAGLPIAAVGALTRRAGIYFVASRRDGPAVQPEDLLVGHPPGVRAGIQLGAGGSEPAVRFWLAARGALSLAPLSEAQVGPLGVPVPPGTPTRWIGYSTGEALVAAIMDSRLAAFFGRSIAAGEAALAGGAELSVTSAEDMIGADVLAALCTVLVARRDRATAGDHFLLEIVRDCARAAEGFSSPGAVTAAARALPDRDALHLTAALGLDAPSAGRSVFAADARLPDGAVPHLLDLLARSGMPVAGVDAAGLVRQLA